MQVTSMFSAGYLEPERKFNLIKGQNGDPDLSRKNIRARGISQLNNFNNEDTGLKRQEQDVLSQEQNLKSKLGSGAEIHTVYHYTLGADGKRYITGASVTMKGEEDDLSRVGGGVSTRDIQVKADENLQKVHGASDERSNARRSDDAKNSGGNNLAGGDNELSEEEQQLVRELEQTEREVIAHEAAHQAAAGQFGGGVSYSYTKGPDGKSYITGGEVPIQMRTGSTPEETLRNMEQVQRAASAPADPSGQDRKVAAKAAAIAAQARQEQAASLNQNSSSGSSQTEVARGTPVFNINNINNANNDKNAPVKNGVASVMASIRELQVQALLPAA